METHWLPERPERDLDARERFFASTTNDVRWDMAPVTSNPTVDAVDAGWDTSQPIASSYVAPGAMGAGGELFGDGDGEATVITSHPYELRPRFTGRQQAMASLAQTLASTLAGDLGFGILVGEPGMGKSRMLGEFLSRARASHPNLLVMTGVCDESGTPYGAIAQALSRRIGATSGQSTDEVRALLAARVGDVIPPAKATEITHLVAHLLRVPFDNSPIVEPLVGSPQRLEGRTFMALRRLIAAEATSRPVLLCLENLELSGVETINLIQYLVAGLRGQRVMVLGTATSALFDRHVSFGEGDIVPTRIALGAMAPEECDALVRELCKSFDQVPERLLTHARLLGGSPRAIHELVRLLLESGCVTRGLGPTWRVDTARLAELALPSTYEEIVAARLAVMQPSERRALEMAAALGEVAWFDAILAIDRSAHLQNQDPDGPTLAQIAASGDQSRQVITAAITTLVEREWLTEGTGTLLPGDRELRFANPVLWSLVYASVDRDRRAAYHGVVARWLELHPDGRGATAQEEVARHLELAGEAREAALRYRRAAEIARSQFANEQAIRLYDHALSCVGTTDNAARIHMWHDLGSVYELIGDFEAALGAFERMLRLSWIVASKTKAAVAFNKMGRVWRRRGDLRLALEYLERGLDLFRSTQDERGIAGSLDDIGKALHLLGRYDEAYAKITDALARRGKGGDPRAIATSLSTLGTVQMDRGQIDAALTCHQEALELRRKAGDRWGMIVSQNHLAAIAFETGGGTQARERWMSALDEAEKIGAQPLCALVLANLGELAISEGKHEEARRRLEEALEIIEDIEDRQLETECCRHLAHLEIQLGHADVARNYASRALNVARKAGLREKEAQACLVMGEVSAASLYDAGATDIINDGVTAYERAIELLRGIRNDSALGRALLSYGRYQAERGHIATGKDMVREAVAIFSRLGLTGPAADADKLLASLA